LIKGLVISEKGILADIQPEKNNERRIRVCKVRFPNLMKYSGSETDSTGRPSIYRK
jgi:hypothetical protein